MKKVTFLTCVLALCTSTMFAQTLEVTTADMDPVAAGGLVYEGIIANHSALELPIEEGVYLIVVDKAIQKLIIK